MRAQLKRHRQSGGQGGESHYQGIRGGVRPDQDAKMSTILEPPSFVSEKKSFGEYKKDLLRWSRLTSLDKKVQAEMVVYRLEGHPSRIKEKITTQLSD